VISGVQDHFTEKCTTIIAQTKKGIVLCHNEDYLSYPANPLYIVRAQQKNKPSFLSAGYIGSLAGSSAGINSAGLAMSGNSVSVNDFRFGILKNFICRAILDETDVSQATENIQKTRRAIGGNYIIIDSSGEGGFVETSTKESAQLISILPCFHTNHFISQKMKDKESSVSQSSLQRYSRLKKIFGRIGKRNVTINELKEILSDHSDWPIGICRHDYESDKRRKNCSTTLASIMMNPAQQTIYAASGNPCRAKYKAYEL